VFNILNTAIWAAMPARVFLTPSSFGNIQNTFGRTESFGTARQVQLAVRYSFWGGPKTRPLRILMLKLLRGAAL
jgi:hypothetical protein